MSQQSLHGRWQAAWQEDAACSGTDTDEFFAESRKTVAEELEASWPQLLRCFSCPVRRECLEQSFIQDETRMRDEFGIFGGATPAMRDEALFDPAGIEKILAIGEWEAALIIVAAHNDKQEVAA